MLILPIPTESFKKEYLKHYLAGLIDRVKNGYSETINGKTTTHDLDPVVKDILLPGWNTQLPDNDNLKKLLVSEPVELKKLNDDLEQRLVKANPAKVIDKALLLKIFGYEKVFNKSSKNEAYWLAQRIGRNTCTYCNRIYTFTVVKDGGTNSKNRIARPEFDHWFDKSDYPLMSLSLFNLIPSCPVCNSSIKGTIKFGIDTHTHPYIHESVLPDITFRASLTPSSVPKWTVKIDTPTGSKEKRTVEDLKLEEIYACHGELEVKDIMDFEMAYPPDYLKQLFNGVLSDSKGSLSKYDVYRMLFGAELDSSKYLDRPLSKMKHDILLKLGVITE